MHQVRHGFKARRVSFSRRRGGLDGTGAKRRVLRWSIQMHATTDVALASIGKAIAGTTLGQSECTMKIPFPILSRAQ